MTTTSTGHDVTTGHRHGAGGSLSSPLVILVHSAEFTVDLGHLSKQDPYIKIKIGHTHKERTTAKTRAGKSAVWDETLRFNHLEKLEGTDHIVHISARDKNLFKDNIIGITAIPLSELLRRQGQRELDLFDKSDSSILTGRVLVTVSGGESLLGEGRRSDHHHGIGAGAIGAGAVGATGAALAGHSRAAREHENLIIQVISAQFTRDIGTLARQDPYIKITVGHQTEKTSQKSRAGLSAVWNETLTFTKLERLPEGKSYDVIISAWDKDMIKDDEIGNVKVPLNELLGNQGQELEYNLYDPRDVRQIAGRLLLFVSVGEGFGDKRHHGLGVGGLPGVLEHGTTGVGTSGTPGGMGAGSTGYGTTLLGAGHDGGRHGGIGTAAAGGVGTGLGTRVGTGDERRLDTSTGVGVGPTGMGTTVMGAGHDGGLHGEQHILGTGTTGKSGSRTAGFGNLSIIVHSAQFLKDHDIFSKQDPYIVITIGDQTLKTKAKNNAGKSAIWDETLTFTDLERLDAKNQTVLIKAMDQDLIIDDDIGRVTIPLSELLSSQGQREYELFYRGDRSKSAGRVLLSVIEGSAGTTGIGTPAGRVY